jgi:hypothetical protein
MRRAELGPGLRALFGKLVRERNSKKEREKEKKGLEIGDSIGPWDLHF